MVGRISPILTFAMLLLCGAARGEVVGEAQVIAMVRERDPDARAARAAAAVSSASEVEAGLYPNPSLGWEREHYPGDGPEAEAEDSVFLSIPIEISGRRGAKKALARSDAASARADAARAASDAVVDALEAFYTAIAAERRARIARTHVAQLDRAARVLGRRRTEGTVSGYEALRLELEAELARSELHDAEARALAERTELALRLGVDPKAVALRGDLATAPVERRTGARRSLALARQSASEARAARESAVWAWVPGLSVAGGLRVGSSDTTRYGYVAGVELSLPLFSRGQELTARADAQRELAAARLSAAERAARIEAARAAAELARARGELARLTQATGDRLERLARAAASGYREGELSLVELLDAQRARTAVERRRLELALAAKRAEVRLRAARGEFE